MARRIGLILLLVAGIATEGCKPSAPPQNADPSQPQAVTLALNWSAEAEHGGFYAAQAEGYFAEEGLEVKIVPGGPKAPVIQNVAGGTATFGIATADQIVQGRAAGANVVAVFAAMQDSPRCVMVHEETGIEKVVDLHDVTIAVRPGITFYEYLKTKAELKNVKVVPYGGSVAQFLLDKNYAQQAYVFSEPFIAEEQGAKPRALMVSDIGYNPYSSVLFTRDDVAAKDAELVAKMKRACQRGWQKYLEDPANANDLIRKDNPEISLAALEYGAKAIKPLCLPNDADPSTLGQMKKERWKALIEQLVELKLLESKQVKPKDAFVE